MDGIWWQKHLLSSELIGQGMGCLKRWWISCQQNWWPLIRLGKLPDYLEKVIIMDIDILYMYLEQNN